MMSVDPKKVLWGALERMARTRLSELLIAQKYPEQKMRCPAHLCLGQEASGGFFGALAGPDDIFFGNYRSHGHYLSRGGNLKAMFAELLGFAEGCSQGLGGSMHLIDLENKFFGSSAIVASTIPIAAGAALRFKQTGKGDVAVVFFGDAALEEGVAYETMNLAVLHRLPVVFVCENNRMAVLTPLEQRSCTPILHSRFSTLDVPGAVVDGWEPEAIMEATSTALASARQGRPALLEFRMVRWAVHVGHNFQGPIDVWWQNPSDPSADQCPMARTVRSLQRSHGVELSAVREMRDRTLKEVEAAYEEASRGTPPSPSVLTEGVWAGPLLSKLPHPGEKSVRPTDEPHREQNRMVNPF